jgi:hypothetical protein
MAMVSFWYGEAQGGATAWVWLNPDAPLMSFDDFFANGQSDAAAGVIAA